MTEPEIIQGRPIGVTELDQIRQLVAAYPRWSRRSLNQHLARLWEWRNARGQLKDMAARTLMLKLEQTRLDYLTATSPGTVQSNAAQANARAVRAAHFVADP